MLIKCVQLMNAVLAFFPALLGENYMEKQLAINSKQDF